MAKPTTPPAEYQRRALAFIAEQGGTTTRSEVGALKGRDQSYTDALAVLVERGEVKTARGSDTRRWLWLPDQPLPPAVAATKAHRPKPEPKTHTPTPEQRPQRVGRKTPGPHGKLHAIAACGACSAGNCHACTAVAESTAVRFERDVLNPVCLHDCYGPVVAALSHVEDQADTYQGHAAAAV